MLIAIPIVARGLFDAVVSLPFDLSKHSINLGWDLQSGRKIVSDPPDFGASGSFLIWSLVIIGIIIAAFFLLRRFVRGTHGFFPPGVINILARRKLSANHEIYLVEVGPKIILIGLTKDRLGTLGEFNSAEDVALLRSRFVKKEFHDALKAEVGEKSETGSIDRIKDQIKSMQSTVDSWK